MDHRSAIAAEPNLPIDPNYVNHVLEDNHAKANRLLPMASDAMIFELEDCLVNSALEANDKGTPDRVCFYPFS
jgi:hypothetical protein